MTISGYAALQPSRVVYVSKDQPTLGEDDFLVDDNAQEFFVVANSFGLTMKSRIKKVRITITAR